MNPLEQLRKLLAEIKEREAAATPGPWDIGTLKWNAISSSHNSLIKTLTPKGKYGSSRPIGTLHMAATWSDPAFADAQGFNCWELPMQANADFIAAARTDIPRLVQALEALLVFARKGCCDNFCDDDQKALADALAALRGEGK